MWYPWPSHMRAPTVMFTNQSASSELWVRLVTVLHLCHHTLVWQRPAGKAKHACVKALVFCTRVSEKTGSLDSLPSTVGASHADICSLGFLLPQVMFTLATSYHTGKKFLECSPSLTPSLVLFSLRKSIFLLRRN